MDNHQWMQTVILSNNRQRKEIENKDVLAYLQSFQIFNSFTKSLFKKSNSWIITNLNRTRYERNNYYAVKFNGRQLSFFRNYPNKQENFKLSLITGNLTYNDEETTLPATYALFATQLRQIAMDLSMNQAFVFKKKGQ